MKKGHCCADKIWESLSHEEYMVCTVQGVDKLFNLAGLSSKQGISSAKSGGGGSILNSQLKQPSRL